MYVLWVINIRSINADANWLLECNSSGISFLWKLWVEHRGNCSCNEYSVLSREVLIFVPRGNCAHLNAFDIKFRVNKQLNEFVLLAEPTQFRSCYSFITFKWNFFPSAHNVCVFISTIIALFTFYKNYFLCRMVFLSDAYMNYARRKRVTSANMSKNWIKFSLSQSNHSKKKNLMWAHVVSVST